MHQTRGIQITTVDGRPVTLRGIGLGGWMNMEHFITGYPATEALQRPALHKALGEEGYRRFFDRFLDVFYGDADAAFIASLGMNLVRLPVNYLHVWPVLKCPPRARGSSPPASGCGAAC